MTPPINRPHPPRGRFLLCAKNGDPKAAALCLESAPNKTFSADGLMTGLQANTVIPANKNGEPEAAVLYAVLDI